MSLFLLWFIWHELSPFPPPRVAYTTSREKTTWRDWLMNVTEYESLNLIFSSCFVAHLPPRVPSALSNSNAASSHPWTQGRKIQRSNYPFSKVLMSFETWEAILFYVPMAWALMGEEKLTLVWAERLWAPAELLWGPDGQVRCKAEHRETLPRVAAEGRDSSTLQGLWHIRERTQGARCTQQNGGESDLSKKTPAAVQQRVAALKWSAGYISKNDLGERTWVGFFSQTHDTSLEGSRKPVGIQQEEEKTMSLSHMDVYLKVALFVPTSWWGLGYSSHLK